jgi:hypothetical protein
MIIKTTYILGLESGHDKTELVYADAKSRDYGSSESNQAVEDMGDTSRFTHNSSRQYLISRRIKSYPSQIQIYGMGGAEQAIAAAPHRH